MYVLDFAINRFSDLHFVNIIFVILGISMSASVLRSTRKSKSNYLFFVYALLSCLLIFALSLIIISPIEFQNKLNISPKFIESAIQLTEAATYFIFFSQMNMGGHSNKLLLATGILFAGVITFFQINNIGLIFSLNTNEIVRISELLFIFCLSLFYFTRLIRNIPKNNFISDWPSLLILIGVFFYGCFSVSMILLSPAVINEPLTKHFLVYLPYYLNLLFINKSLQCKSTPST